MGLVPEAMKAEVEKRRTRGIESKISGAGRGGHLFTLVDKETTIIGWKEVEIDTRGFKDFCIIKKYI